MALEGEGKIIYFDTTILSKQKNMRQHAYIVWNVVLNPEQFLSSC